MKAVITGIAIVDLDGPVLDGRERHYACYREIVVELGYAPLDINTYWDMKRHRASRREQLAAIGAGAAYDVFRAAWIQRIEQPRLLELDRLQPMVIETLAGWRDRGIVLALATMRREPAYLRRELEAFRLLPLLDHVIVSDFEGGGVLKAERVRAAMPGVDLAAGVWIGDTEADIAAARNLGCRIWALSCGLRTEEYLRTLDPDFIDRYLSDVRLADNERVVNVT